MSTTAQDRDFEAGGNFVAACDVPPAPAVTFTFSIVGTHLIQSFSDGTSKDLGRVVGSDGTSAAFTFSIINGRLVQTYADGTKNDLGAVAGAAGKGVQTAQINTAGRLIFTYTDNTTQDVGQVVKDISSGLVSTVIFPTSKSLTFPHANQQYLVKLSWNSVDGVFQPAPLGSHPLPSVDTTEWFLEASKSGQTQACFSVFIPPLAGTNPYGPVSLNVNALLMGVWSNPNKLTVTNSTWSDPILLA